MTDDRSQTRDVLQTLSAEQLVRSWKQDFGIDVGHLFTDITEIEMHRNTRTGHVIFEPMVLGNPVFYQALRQYRWYHPKKKREHVEAARMVQPASFVLDIGAGNGGFGRHLKDAAYIGLESDKDAVESAQTKGINLRAQDMMSWRASTDFKPADVVTAFQVLEHVEAPANFIREMTECLIPGGTLILGVPDAESYVTKLPDFMLNAPPHHVSWWTETALTELLEKEGLQIDVVRRFCVEPWEYQLWWMAKFASIWRGNDAPKFGAALRPRKVLSFILSWPLQWLSPPRSARGSTLLIAARKTS